MDKTGADSHKLSLHPERVAEWQRTGDCFPIYVEIGLTNRCNHKCIFCALDWLEHKGVDIDKDVLLSNLEDMASHGVKSVMFAGEGEPFLHKNAFEFIQKARESGIDVSSTTNGSLFDKRTAEKCLPYMSWIRFSVDAGSSEIYSEIHGVRKEDFERVLENIKYSVEFKKKSGLKTTIGVQALILNKNLDSLLELARICRDIGVDNLQVKPYSKHPSSKNNFSASPIEMERLYEQLQVYATPNFNIICRRDTQKRIEQGITYSECYGLPFTALVDAKGNIIPCNIFYNNPDFVYGNLYEHSFSEIWHSDKRKRVIKKIKSQGTGECRKGCRLDSINRYLDRLKNPWHHDNFI